MQRKDNFKGKTHETRQDQVSVGLLVQAQEKMIGSLVQSRSDMDLNVRLTLLQYYSSEHIHAAGIIYKQLGSH